MFLQKSPPKLAKLVSGPASGSGKVRETQPQNSVRLKDSQTLGQG